MSKKHRKIDAPFQTRIARRNLVMQRVDQLKAGQKLESAERAQLWRFATQEGMFEIVDETFQKHPPR